MKHLLLILLLLAFTNCTVENDGNDILEQSQDIDNQDLDVIEITSYYYKGKTYDSTDAIQGLDLDKIDIVYFEQMAFVFDTREESDAFTEKGILQEVEQDGKNPTQIRNPFNDILNNLHNAVFVNLYKHFNGKGARRSFASLKEKGGSTFRIPSNLINKVSSVESYKRNRRSASYVIKTNNGPTHTAGAITTRRIDNLRGSQNDRGNRLKINVFF